MHEGREYWDLRRIVEANAGSGTVVVVVRRVLSSRIDVHIASESLASLDVGGPFAIVYHVWKFPLSSSPLAVVVIAFRVCSRCETGSNLESSEY